MVAVRGLALPFGMILLGVLNAYNANGEVGIRSASGRTIDRFSTMGAGMWHSQHGVCRVGRPGNVVVTPLRGSTRKGGELLDTKRVGPYLCAWLSMIERAHNKMQTAWHQEHQRRKSQVSWWNIYKRILNWFKKFPDFEVQVLTRYLDLWNKDRFGHNMPWITAEFSYQCPSEDEGYGLFSHLCGSVFAKENDPRVPEEVTLLLQPRPGYNQPLTVTPGKREYLVGLYAGLRSRRSAREKEKRDGWAWASGAISRLNSFMRITGRIDDCWMNRGSCYFKSLLRMEWRGFKETVCERLHRDANENVFMAVKAAQFDTVRINIFSVDFFSHLSPLMWGSLDEGVLRTNVGSGLLKLKIDTNPQNQVDFERVQSTTQNVRAANFVVKGVKKIVSSVSKGKGQPEKSERMARDGRDRHAEKGERMGRGQW